MKPQDSRNSGRRSGRGPRRSASRPRSDSRPSSPTPVKISFWQRLKAFFTPRAKPPLKSAPARPKYEGSSSSTQGSAREARAPRKPEAVEVTSPKLYVGNLAFDAAESDLSELFNGVGTVRNAEIVTNKFNEKSKGFGFVTMGSVEEARRAVQELHDKDFMGRKLVVSGAKSTEREPNCQG